MLTVTEFEALFERSSTWGRWGEADRRGALNHITPAVTAAALAEVEDGVTVSLARPLETVVAADDDAPLQLTMLNLPEVELPGANGVGAALDHLALACHGEVHSHLDALCHISFRGRLYNGVPAGTVTAAGSADLGLGAAGSGIVTRAVLADVAGCRGGEWLEPGDAVTLDELRSSLESRGLSVRPGDVLAIRTGHATRRKALGPWDAAHAKAGLHPEIIPWLREVGVSALAFDGDGDVAPFASEVPIPVHVLGITALGLHFFDALDLDAVSQMCTLRDRWSFAFVAAPLRADQATGCAINPIAIF